MILTTTKLRRDGKWQLTGWVTFHTLLILAALGGLPYIVIWSVAGGRPREHVVHQGMACYPDGSAHFELWTQPWQSGNQAWMPSLFLSITNPVKKDLTFPEAKAIDVGWDLAVGRGGQLLLCVLAYPVIRKALLLDVERRPTTFRLFSAVAFDRISIVTLYALGTGQAHTRRPDRWSRPLMARSGLYTAATFIVTYLLAWPTFLSVMTGYAAEFQAYVRNPQDTDVVVKYDQFDPSLRAPSYILLDGHRVGLPDRDPLHLDGKDLDEFDSSVSSHNIYANRFTLSNYFTTLRELEKSLNDSSGGKWNWTNGSQLTFDLQAHDGVVEAISQYGDYSLSFPETITSTEQVVSNLTLFLSDSETAQIVSLAPPPLHAHYNLLGGGETYFYIGNTEYNASWMSNSSNISCQASGSYRWGFSTELLLTFTFTTAIYIILVTLLHWLAHIYSQADRYDNGVSVYRDVLDLAEELKVQLGDEVQGMSARDLEERVNDAKGAIQLDVRDLSMSRREEHKASTASLSMW
ncbi:hypothetical protein LTR17_022665 [Elasticomyces elasticus]|nr:hypothetical protein LTR17_022665 [Elasticomyces elasticus]